MNHQSPLTACRRAGLPSACRRAGTCGCTSGVGRELCVCQLHGNVGNGARKFRLLEHPAPCTLISGSLASGCFFTGWELDGGLSGCCRLSWGDGCGGVGGNGLTGTPNQEFVLAGRLRHLCVAANRYRTESSEWTRRWNEAWLASGSKRSLIGSRGAGSLGALAGVAHWAMHPAGAGGEPGPGHTPCRPVR